MKKRIVSIVVGLCCVILYGQDKKNEIGVIIGVQDSSYRGNDDGSLNYTGKMGYHLGISGIFPINKIISFKPELLYLERAGSNVNMEGGGSGFGFFSSDGDNLIHAKIDEYLILMPILIDFTFWRKFSLGIGPVPGYALNREVDYSNDRFDGLIENNKSDNFDLSFALDFGYSFEKLRLFTRYTHGVIERQGLNTSIFQLGLNFKLPNLIPHKK